MMQNNSWHASHRTQRPIDQSEYVFVEILFVKILEGVYSHTQNWDCFFLLVFVVL